MAGIWKVQVGKALNSDYKVTNDLERLQEKHPKVPLEDIRLSRIRVFCTKETIVGMQSFFELVDQKKKNNPLRRPQDKITFEVEGESSRGSKFWGVDEIDFVMNQNEYIIRLEGYFSQQIDSITFLTNTGKTGMFPPVNKGKISSAHKIFNISLPQGYRLLAFKSIFQRFLLAFEIQSIQVFNPLIHNNFIPNSTYPVLQNQVNYSSNNSSQDNAGYNYPLEQSYLHGGVAQSQFKGQGVPSQQKNPVHIAPISGAFQQKLEEKNQIQTVLLNTLLSDQPAVRIELRGHSVSSQTEGLVSFEIFVSQVRLQNNHSKSVLRKYREFQALRNYFLALFPCIPVPQLILPEEIAASAESQHVSLQEYDVRSFLEELLASKILFFSPGTRQFLEPTMSEKVLLQELKIKPKTPQEQRIYLQEFRDKYFPKLKDRALEAKEDQTAKQFKSFVKSKLDTVRLLEKRARILKDKMAKYISAINQFKNSFLPAFSSSLTELVTSELLPNQQPQEQEQKQPQQLQQKSHTLYSTQILLTGQRQAIEHSLLYRELRAYLEFTRLFEYQEGLVEQAEKASQKFSNARLIEEQYVIQEEITFLDKYVFFISQIFCYFIIPVHFPRSTKSYIQTIQNVAAAENIDSLAIQDFRQGLQVPQAIISMPKSFSEIGQQQQQQQQPIFNPFFGNQGEQFNQQEGYQFFEQQGEQHNQEQLWQNNEEQLQQQQQQEQQQQVFQEPQQLYN